MDEKKAENESTDEGGSRATLLTWVEVENKENECSTFIQIISKLLSHYMLAHPKSLCSSKL
jgi:hypothetical protein